MKKLFVLVSFALLTLIVAAGVSAQEDEFAFPEANQPFVVFSEGAACSWLTRIIKQSGRNNFVFDDFLPGLYFRTDLHNIKYITPMIRLAALYPLVSTFNQFPQKPKTPLHFGADLTCGLKVSILDLKYFRLNAGPALHLFFMSADRWNYFEMGAAAFAGMELPLSENWTLLCNGFASIDNGNLGSNRAMEPFDIAYQYQVDIGVRYSTKLKNRTFLFSGKESESDASLLMR
jgi:hypothetical protein